MNKIITFLLLVTISVISSSLTYGVNTPVHKLYNSCLIGDFSFQSSEDNEEDSIYSENYNHPGLQSRIFLLISAYTKPDSGIKPFKWQPPE
jgi:hypothetical protein